MAIGGKDTVIKHGTNGATTTLTTFTTKTRSAGFSTETETVEGTVFGDAFRDFSPSFQSGTLALTYKYDDTIWGQITAIKNGQDVVDFEVSPVGTGTGKPKVTFSAFITNLSMDFNIGDLMEFPVDWQIDGAITYGTHT